MMYVDTNFRNIWYFGKIFHIFVHVLKIAIQLETFFIYSFVFMYVRTYVSYTSNVLALGSVAFTNLGIHK